VAVFQLHLGALVSGEAEQDGLDTIDQRDRTYETRVVRCNPVAVDRSCHSLHREFQDSNIVGLDQPGCIMRFS
jgi:hypothetical protein